MFEKSLHAGNIAASFTLVATAVDMTFAGGAATTIGATLSGLALFKKSGKPDQKLSLEMAEAMQSSLANQHITIDQKKLVAQMLLQFKPSEMDIAHGNMDAGTVAKSLGAVIENTAGDPAQQHPTVVHAFVTVIEETLAPHLTTRIETDPKLAGMKVLLERSKLEGQTKRLIEAGVTEKAIFNLVRSVPTDPGNLGQAWIELQNLVEAAISVQADGRVTSNHGEFWDAVSLRVAELAAEGEYESAGMEIDEALAREEKAKVLANAESDARSIEFIDRGIKIATLSRDAGKIAKLLLDKVDLASESSQKKDALNQCWHEFWERGRDTGDRLDLEVSERLAHSIFLRASNSVELAHSHTLLGNSKSLMGKNGYGIDFHRDAVVDLQTAVALFSEGGETIAYAMAKSNLGMALTELGKATSDRKLLRDAETVLHSALSIWSEGVEPSMRATAICSIAGLQEALAEWSGETQYLYSALKNYKSALKFFSPENDRYRWLAAKNGIGNCYKILADFERPSDFLKAAKKAFRDALINCPRIERPLLWASLQNNLGNVYQRLGEKSSNTNLLSSAISAYEMALEERSQDLVPVDWGDTMNNLGIALQTLAEQTSCVETVRRSISTFDKAQLVRQKDIYPNKWAKTEENKAVAYMKLFQITKSDSDSLRALQSFDLVIAVYSELDADRSVARAQHNKAFAKKAISKIKY